VTEKVWYWVMQTVKGQVYAHGPYSSSSAAENRRDNVKGGEATVFGSFSKEPEKAILEFRDAEVTRL
jgi:hypothetical protein